MGLRSKTPARRRLPRADDLREEVATLLMNLIDSEATYNANFITEAVGLVLLSLWGCLGGGIDKKGGLAVGL